MFSLNGLLIGLGLVVAGVLFVKYTFAIANLTGSQDWLERITGPGSTYGIYKIFGVLLVILGLLVGTGYGSNVLAFLLAPVHSVFQPLGH